MRMNETTRFEDAARIWLSVKQLEVKANTYSESYERTVEKILLPRMKNIMLGEIDREYMANMFMELSEHYSDSTLHKCQLVMEGVFNEANYAGAKLIPLPKIKIKSKIPQKEKQTYSSQEVELIKEFAKFHRYGLSVLLLIELGLRCSEMLALSWEDIDFNLKSVKINKACVAIKGGGVIDVPKSKSSIRELPLSDMFCEHLSFYAKGQSGYIINNGKRLMTPANYTKNRYNKFFDDMAREGICLKRLSPHELRHTCGTLFYVKTGDLYAVSKYLGHSSVAVTAKYYVHSDVELLRERLKI